jgi:membrane protease YdiL (CAAX protease family)
MAALPALAEEALFRGWVLRGLRSEMSGVAAILLSSVIFGVFHMEPARIAFTAALGAGLAFLALRTGSIWPGAVAHALHNGVTMGVAKTWMEAPETATAVRVFSGQVPAAGIAGLAAAGAGLLLVHLSTRGGSGESSPVRGG